MKQMLFIALLMPTLFSVNGDLFSSIVDMEELFKDEANLIKDLSDYTEKLQETLEHVRRVTQRVKLEHEEAAKSDEYLANPIHSYLLIKRLTVDWKDLQNEILTESTDYVKRVLNMLVLKKVPGNEDLDLAALGILRLQSIYKLKTGHLSTGILHREQTYKITSMTASDCYEIGRMAYLNSNYYHTVSWMWRALELFYEEQKIIEQSIKKEDILQYLAFAMWKEGDTAMALKLTNELLEILPYEQLAIQNKLHFEIELRELEELKKGKSSWNGQQFIEQIKRVTSFKVPKIVDEEAPEYPDDSFLPPRSLYEKGCRGEFKLSTNVTNSLHCRYTHNNIDFLRIAPLKLEELHKPQPYIVIYHEIISDEDIELLKKLAKPKFRTSGTQHYSTGQTNRDRKRISKTGWLADEEHPVILKLSQRMSDLTSGLTTKSAEDFQVANYGIGGHFEGHFDFARKHEKLANFLDQGNRLATVLIYMSEILGGATVFPAIQVSVQPQKGVALVWYNLYKSGTGDHKVFHGACPVLQGSKWIATKWMHSYENEFLWPCELQPDHSFEF